MIRSELTKRVAKDNPNLALRDVERLVSAMFNAISDHLVAGGRIELRGFAAFSPARATPGPVAIRPPAKRSTLLPSA